jgi:hypothetical protein
MNTTPRVPLSKDQPYLRRRRAPAPDAPARTELDFWRHFDLEKFARDWRRESARARKQGDAGD